MEEKEKKENVIYSLDEGKEEKELKQDLKVSLKIAIVLGSIIFILIAIIVVIGFRLFDAGYLSTNPFIYDNEKYGYDDGYYEDDYYDDSEDTFDEESELQYAAQYSLDFVNYYTNNPNEIIKDYSEFLIDYEKIESSNPEYVKYSCTYKDFMKEFKDECCFYLSDKFLDDFEGFKDIIKEDKDGKLLIKKPNESMKNYSYDTTLGKITITNIEDDIYTIEAKYIMDIYDENDSDFDSEYGDVTFKVKKIDYRNFDYDNYYDFESDNYEESINEEYEKYYREVFNEDIDLEDDDYYDEDEYVEDEEIEDMDSEEDYEYYYYIVQDMKIVKAGNKKNKAVPQNTSNTVQNIIENTVNNIISNNTISNNTISNNIVSNNIVSNNTVTNNTLVNNSVTTNELADKINLEEKSASKR